VKIKKVALENFLSYGEKREIEVGDLSLIVGPNGAGKTNLVRALTLLSKILAGQTVPDIQYYAHSPKEPFTVEVELELSDEEKKAVREWLSLPHMGLRDCAPRPQELFRVPRKALGKISGCSSRGSRRHIQKHSLHPVPMEPNIRTQLGS